MSAARVLTSAALVVAALAAAAFAQDAQPAAPAAKATPASAPSASGQRLDLVVACETRDGLSLCVRPKTREKKPFTRLAEDDSSSRFSRLTRLAGMFMGRVDAASVGDFRLRFTLDLR